MVSILQNPTNEWSHLVILTVYQDSRSPQKTWDLSWFSVENTRDKHHSICMIYCQKKAVSTVIELVPSFPRSPGREIRRCRTPSGHSIFESRRIYIYIYMCKHVNYTYIYMNFLCLFMFIPQTRLPEWGLTPFKGLRPWAPWFCLCLQACVPLWVL